ncbi:hypothetical protein [Nonlabens sp. SY33080]|uniref:hypothetical protein n=1 Tax=Nonlabens sp. SY33080 TaxID=2719911 RepID=UPI0014289E9B|nr:hypothetical protein [Nonlabens sp. SY33080]
MQNIQFPVNFKFKISTISNDFVATDATGKTVAYVRQKMFKLKESVNVYTDESRTQILYNIKADKWLDWSTAYSMIDPNGRVIGKVARKGWRSMWKAEYHIVDQNNQPQYIIKERSAMTRFLDGLLGEIPVLGFFTGYLFNPAYDVTVVSNGSPVVELVKEPSFFGRKFSLNKISEIDQDDKIRVMLSLMMMILLERRRG